MAPSSLKTDSPVARRIVRSFIDFLNSVEAAAPGADLEGLEVAKECLAEVFKLDSSSTSDCTKPDLLVNLFNSLEARGNNDLGIRSDPSHKETSVDAPSSSSVLNTGDTNLSNSSKSLANDRSRESFSGVSRDELFGQFFAALEKIHFFKTMPDGSDDPAQLDKATRLFHDAVTEMEAAGCQAFNQNNLAESLKSQGNRAMQSKLYLDAVELYTCAIALCENNAVYYCNRAAAYTQIHKYSEAIADCLKSIEIDPNYSKAYSRLGLAYYAQGNYGDAIDKGFKKALQLDPNNDSVKENIRVAEQKLNEEKQRTERDQNTSSASGTNQDSRNQSSGGSRNRATPFPSDSGSLPADFNIMNNSLPADFASMLMNMAANAYQGQHSTSSASGTNQDSRNQSSGESRNHATPFQFTSIPADSGSLPADFASMFMNMAANAYQGQTGGDESNANSSSEPEIRLGGNTSLNFGEQMPEELTGALRSVMEMFSGAAAAPHGSSNTRDTANERPPN